MRTETKALKMRSAKRESDVAGMSPLLEGLRASPDVLWKKQCLSSQCQRWVESPEARTQRRVSSHSSGVFIFGLTYYLFCFIFGLGWFFFFFFFKLIGLKKTGIQGMYIMMGKNQR